MLIGKPVLAYIWLYLFVRGLLEPGGRVDRGAFADEYSPGLSPERQRKRLRDRLGDMFKRDLPAVLSSRLIADRTELRLGMVAREVSQQRADEAGGGDSIAGLTRDADRHVCRLWGHGHSLSSRCCGLLGGPPALTP